MSNAERQRRWRERRAAAEQAMKAEIAHQTAAAPSGLHIEQAHSERLTEQLVSSGLELGYWRNRALSLQAERDALQARLDALEQQLAAIREA